MDTWRRKTGIGVLSGGSEWGENTDHWQANGARIMGQEGGVGKDSVSDLKRPALRPIVEENQEKLSTEITALSKCPLSQHCLAY
jgi:hypothetical protein